jgi:hypothetical protein
MAAFASRLDAAQRQHAAHARDRPLGLGKQPRLVGEAEQLGQVQSGAP